MRVGQQVVTGGQKYSFPMPNANNNLVIFDVHNDSPYNVGISLGVDSGINNCDYYTSPHGAIFGISPFGADHRTIGGAKWNGTIFVYTEVPAGGGGTTNLASAPASSVTVLGYPKGYQPQAQIALNRMQTTANTVATSGNVASTSVVNDNNPASTQWAEATQSGGPASNVSGTVDGNFQLNQWDGTTKKNLLHTIPNAGAGNSSLDLLTSGLFGRVLGNLALANAVPLQAFDNATNKRNILQVDANNNLQLFTISGLDILQILNAAGSVKATFDNVNGLLNMAGTKQTINGSTSGTMDIYEVLSGAIKVVIGIQTNFQQGAAAINIVTLKTAFTVAAMIFNFGSGGVVTANGGVADTNRQITWGTSAPAGGSQANSTQILQDSAGFTVAGFTAVGSAGSYASSHGGITAWIGI